ncbi:hypothetical protein [Caulobacter sp. CCH9-E1]|jgi:hypothetical protein|uniref:hypothetical protein n=1 Tax=Caulobacter sp. CCH9-E1 TaxID=1768768 RepID=UPI0008342F4A|nr:hypothetical protein [Caulobacter sp. CCH9-E1]
METWTYSVVPAPGGWAVEQPFRLPLMFLSGGRAEAKAKELAASRGQCAEVLVFDRDHRLLARRRYDQHFDLQLRRDLGEGEARPPA